MLIIGERHVFIGILVAICVALGFCLLGLATPGWGLGFGVFAIGGSTAGLCVISFLLLCACVAVAIIILTGIIKHDRLPIIFLSLLIVTSIFLLSTFAPRAGLLGYSANLIVVAFTFTYLSSIAATYWLFGARGASENISTPPKQQQQQQSPPQYQQQQPQYQAYQNQDDQQQPPRLDISHLDPY